METIQMPERPARVPPQALLLSLLSLWVPVLSSSFFPAWTNEEFGVLVWLLVLVPAFLLSFYRGWRGASLALAGAMAAFSLAQVAVILLDAAPPPPEFMVGGVVVLITVTLGSGWLSDAFRRSLTRAELLALTDAGTGLPNRRHAVVHLNRAFAAAKRGANLSVVVFDLDHFKRINDRFGHQTGDEVLSEFARILTSETRQMHLSCRFGGEEFVTILDGGNAEGGRAFAERVRERLVEHSRSLACGPVTTSAGVAEYEAGMASPDVLLAAADQALYRAKESGRNRVMCLGRLGRTLEAPRRASPVSAEGHVGLGETILVVDDDPAVLRVLLRTLKRRGYNPLGSTDPLEAISIARGLEDPVDLVVVDVVMPGMSGFRLVEILGETQPVRALYISGYGRDDVEWAGVPGTVRAFLPKPIPIEELLQNVRRTLDAPIPLAATHSADCPPGTDTGVRPRMLDEVVAAQSAQLESAYAEMLLRLARATEFRDDTTGRHAERVGRLAGLLARELGLPEQEADLVERAAPLHDVGKIGIPDSVLQKPTSLTPAEIEIMRDHCVMGARLLSGSPHPLLQEAERIALSHHERWDGKGYPRGLSGAQTPRSARITAVADAYDSMLNDRPYRSGLAADRALARIRDERGGQFDPDVVNALEALALRGVLHDLDASEVVGGASRPVRDGVSWGDGSGAGGTRVDGPKVSNSPGPTRKGDAT